MDTKDPKEIQKHEAFSNLFPIDETVKERIKQDMFENGFDQNQPVVLAKWGDQNEPVCVDGYTRLQVAEELSISEIPTVTYTVEDDSGATSNEAIVVISVISVNDNPLANNDSADVDEDGLDVINI